MTRFEWSWKTLQNTHFLINQIQKRQNIAGRPSRFKQTTDFLSSLPLDLLVSASLTITAWILNALWVTLCACWSLKMLPCRPFLAKTEKNQFPDTHFAPYLLPPCAEKKWQQFWSTRTYWNKFLGVCGKYIVGKVGTK